MGGFAGHFGGVTSISFDSGNRFATNSKDQTMKVWDLRRYLCSSEFKNVVKGIRFDTDQDYRLASPSRLSMSTQQRLPCDTSI